MTATSDKRVAESDSKKLSTICHGPIEPGLSPSRLAGRAFVEGYPTTTLEGASYLEIGCGSGANVIAQAAACPEMHFTGTSSEGGSAIAAFAHDAKLKNLDIGDLDLSQFKANLGSFDFVVADDVFSKASTAERMALLVLVHRHLADGGIACIGLDIKAEGRGGDGSEKEGLTDEDRRTCEIAAFIAMAEAAKLHPIGDVDPLKTNAAVLPPALRQGEGGEIDLSVLLGNIDEYANIRHRHVLLCHAGRERVPAGLGEMLDNLFITSALSREDASLSDADMLAAEKITFDGPVKYQTENQTEIVTLALMERNKQFPVRAGRLVGHVATALRKAGVRDVATTEVGHAVAQLCHKLLPTGALITHQTETRALNIISDKPHLAPLALHQVRQGADHITSLTPHRIAIDDVARFVLRRFDGVQTRQQITADLIQAVAAGEIQIPELVATPEARAKATVLKVLVNAARSGLLVS
ncbi:MAG: hypothetical protein COA62_01345 [Rhodobiaceae bacterium]|nr:MAG: hypothetical protein COA62_01345 [Rhodobiaceae bacterium]